MPLLAAGDLWLSLHITRQPEALRPRKSTWYRLRPTESEIGMAEAIAWGRWQVNGRIQEVRLLYYKDVVNITNSLGHPVQGLQYSLNIPRALWEPTGGVEVRGDVLEATRKPSRLIGEVSLSRQARPVRAADGPFQWRCPVGHALALTKTTADNPRLCDVCNCAVLENSPVYSCPIARCAVGFDVCDSCFRTSKLCPGGHVAVPYTVGAFVHAICDTCTAPLRRGAQVFGCVTCDFDICCNCARAHPEGPHVDTRAPLKDKRADSEPFIILYTSGSTGPPKGAIVTAASFFNEVHGMVSTHQSYDGSGVGMIDSPLSVSATPYNLFISVLSGGRVAVYKTLTRVFELAKHISPSSIGLVPQLWAILYKQYEDDLSARLKEAHQHDDSAVELLQEPVRIVLDEEYRSQLGFRVRGLNCGGATPMPHVQAWLKRVFSQCRVTENYASTEAGPITTTSDVNVKDGAGRISNGITVRLVDYGEYKTTDKPYPRGEVLVKTQAGATGYLNRPDLTAEAWDADGFYHTGDIGEMPDSSHIKIIDRKKNVFKLLNGEWVSPENVEAVYTGLCPSIVQIFIHGTSRHSHVVAVAVSSVSAAMRHASGALEKETLAEIKSAADKAGLRHFEVPLALRVLVPSRSADEEAFTVENGGMTQTCKLCRPKLRARFEQVLQELFLETAEIKATVDGTRTERFVILLRKALSTLEGEVASLTSADEEEWTKLGWDSIQTLLWVNLIRQRFHVDVAVDAMLHITESGGCDIHQVSTLVHRAQVGAAPSAATKAVTLVGLVEDRALPLDRLVPRKVTAYDGPTRKPKYFLTGATGFLGAAILRYLAESNQGIEWQCICLVRPKGGSEEDNIDSRALMYLQACLRKRQQMSAELESALTGGSIHVIGGTLSTHNFGLPPERFRQLGAELCGASVIHCASHVSHMASYWTLKPANVDSVCDIVNIAILCQRHSQPTLVHYISSISVVRENNADETYAGDAAEMLGAGGYAQTKWVGEQRLRDASDRGLIRLSIVRPGLLSPDTRSGSANLSDWLSRFIGGTMMIGGYRASTTGKAHLTPVDHAAMYTCHLFTCAEKHTETGHHNTITYHLPVTIIMPVQDLLSLVANATEVIFDRNMRELSEERWVAALAELPSVNPLLPFRAMFEDGLGSIAGHQYAATVASLGPLNGSVGKPRSYTEHEVYNLVGYIGDASVVSDPAIVDRTASGSSRKV